MVSVSLKDFVKTGRFGPVVLGQSRADLRGHLGEPDDLGGTSRRHRKPRIWKYGDFEFHFRDREDFLWLIHADGFEVPRSGANLQVDPWILRRSLPPAELETGLQGLALGFDSAYDELREATIIRTNSGVGFVFASDFRDPSGPPILDAISLAWEP